MGASCHDRLGVWLRAEKALPPPSEPSNLCLFVQTTLDDPAGFGLGVARLTAPGLGTAWSYQGGTVAFRMLHIYMPVHAGARTHPRHAPNSATDDDQISLLLESVCSTLVERGVVPPPPRLPQLGRRRITTPASTC